MADYKDIIGTAVRNNAGNLSDDQKDQIFYDSTNLDFKYRISNVTSVGAWRTAGNLNTARRAVGAAGVGSQALAISGDDDPPIVANVEQWNGGTWTEVNDVNSARKPKGVGTYTAAVAIGGSPTPTHALVENWNGTCWTETTDLNSGRRGAGAAGANYTSALFFGAPAPGPTSTLNES